MMLVHVATVHEVLRPPSVIQMGVEEGPADVEQHAAVAEGTEDRGHAEIPEEGAADRGHEGHPEEGAEAVVLKLARLCATSVVSLATWPGNA